MASETFDLICTILIPIEAFFDVYIFSVCVVLNHVSSMEADKNASVLKYFDGVIGFSTKPQIQIS